MSGSMGNVGVAKLRNLLLGQEAKAEGHCRCQVQWEIDLGDRLGFIVAPIYVFEFWNLEMFYYEKYFLN